MNNNESLALIKQEFEKSLKDGLLNLQIKWLIERAEKLQEIESSWIGIEKNGTSEDADNFYTTVQEILSGER